MSVKRIPDHDFYEYYKIFSNAYPHSGWSGSEDDIQRYIQDRIDIQHGDQGGGYYGCYRDGKLRGVMRVMENRMRVLSRTLTAGCLGAVAVDLFHRKEKVAMDLMDGFFQQCRQQNIHFGALHAFRPDFYKQMGWGYGAKLSKYRLKIAALPQGSTKENVRFLNKQDRDAFQACYLRYFEQTHGLLEKLDNVVDSALEESPYYKTVGVVKNDEISGYMSFFFNEDETKKTEIIIREFVYTTPEALLELLTFLRSLSDQAHLVVRPSSDDHLYHILFDSSGSSESLQQDIYVNSNTFYIYHRSNDSGVCVMYRVLDPVGLFRSLADHDFGGQTCQLKITTSDSMIPENNRSIDIHFSDGYPAVAENGKSEVEIQLDIAHLGSLLMGSVNFTSLWRYGLANISDTRYLSTVSRLFTVDQKPLWPVAF